MEPIFEAVLANDPSRITKVAAAQRMEGGPLRRGATPHALPRRHAPAPGRRRAPVRRLPCAARRRYPRQRGQPARRDGAALRLRCPAAVAALLSAGADPHAATSKAGSTPLHLAVAPTGASGTAGASDNQLEIVRMLLAAGATLADVDRNGIPVADRIQSQALRNALAAEQF